MLRTRGWNVSISGIPFRSKIKRDQIAIFNITDRLFSLHGLLLRGRHNDILVRLLRPFTIIFSLLYDLSLLENRK